MVWCIPAGVNVKDPIPSKVELEKRPWNNRLSAAFTVVGLIVHIALCLALVSSVGYHSTCEGAPLNFQPFDWVEFMSSVDDTRLVADYLGPFIGVIFIGLLMATGWIFALQKWAPIIVWGTLIFEMIMGLALSVYFFVKAETAAGGFTLGIVAVAAVILFFKKSAVAQCGQMLQSAAYCIQANPSQMLVALGLQGVCFGFSALSLAGLVSAPMVGKLVYNDSIGACEFKTPDWAGYASTFIGLSLSFFFFFLSMLRAFVMAGTTAMWYWHNDQPNHIGSFLKWGLSKSLGTVSISSMVLTIVEWIKKKLQSKFATCVNLCNPVFWVFKLLMCVMQEMIDAICTFVILVAAITGEDFCISAGRTMHTLKGKFTQLWVVDGVAKIVLYSGSIVFATVCMFSAWSLAAAKDQVPPFETLDQLFGGEDIFAVILGYLLLILGGFYVYYPIIGITLLTLFPSPFVLAFGGPFVFGLFVACISNYMFSFFANSILDVVSSMFVIVLIDGRNGVRPGAGGQMAKPGSPQAIGTYFQLKDDYDTTKPVAGQP